MSYDLFENLSIFNHIPNTSPQINLISQKFPTFLLGRFYDFLTRNTNRETRKRGIYERPTDRLQDHEIPTRDAFNERKR